jgi:glycosyltransferase involved in cell wall biosynthesis
MRALVVSKAFVMATYRQKLTELSRLGADVIAVAPREWRENGTTQLMEKGPDDGFELVLSSVRWNGHFHLHYYPELPALVRRFRPDLVHMDEEPYNAATYLGVRFAKRVGKPSLFFAWQNLMRRYPPPFNLMERSVFGMVAHGLAGSDDAARVLAHKGYRGPVTIVPQFGVDLDRFTPGAANRGAFTVGFLNRLIPGKAPLLMLEAFRLLPDDARLLFAGDGPIRPALQARVDELGLGSRVELRDRAPSSDVPALMHEVDVIVLPSVTTPSWKEQFGRVLVEGMASGVAVIGSDSGEIPNVIGDAGLVVPEGDATALGDALRRLYEDEGLRCRLAKRGRRRAVEQYSHRRIAEVTFGAYVDAVGHDGARAPARTS